jgi:hypothetical protein
LEIIRQSIFLKKEFVMGTFRDFNADLITNLFFSPDPMLRYQYQKVYEARNRSYDDEPLRNLRLAVLEDGIACFQSYFLKPSPKNEKLSREAEEWVACDSDDPFSFSDICESLEIDPQWLRKELFRWKQKQLRKATGNRKSLSLRVNELPFFKYRRLKKHHH